MKKPTVTVSLEMLEGVRPYVAAWAGMVLARTNHDKTLKSMAKSLLSQIDAARNSVPVE